MTHLLRKVNRADHVAGRLDRLSSVAGLAFCEWFGSWRSSIRGLVVARLMLMGRNAELVVRCHGAHITARTIRDAVVAHRSSFAHRSLRLLLTTLTLLRAMAAPAIMGSSRKPLMGYRIPAAMGMPITL